MKYIIELEDDIKYLIVNGRADNRCYTLVRPVAELEILNSDYINENFGELQDEAYQKGLDEGYKKCLAENDFDQPCTSCNAYKRGYEDGKKSQNDDRIEVGDEVDWSGDKYIVTYLNYDIETSEIKDYDLLAYDGSVADHVLKHSFTKTGKHYDIASILEAMRNDLE